MPFTKLVNRHSCQTPKTRDDGSQLLVGDEWICDELVPVSRNPNIKDTTPCGKQYRWIDDQREGKFWMPIYYKD